MKLTTEANSEKSNGRLTVQGGNLPNVLPIFCTYAEMFLYAQKSMGGWGTNITKIMKLFSRFSLAL